MTDEKQEDQTAPPTKKSRRHFTVEQRIALLDEADKPACSGGGSCASRVP